MNKTMGAILLMSFMLFWAITMQPIKVASKTINVPNDYQSIASAIEKAVEGDTIVVKNGVYEEHSLVINKTLTLLGENKNNTIIKNIDPPQLSYVFPPVDSTSITIAANNITISGFTITNGVVGIGGTGDRTQITNNVIIAEGGRINLHGSNQTIAQNTLLNTPKPPDTTSGSGINIQGAYNKIFKNTLEGASIFGITLERESNFNIIYQNTLTNTGGIDIIGNNNTIAKNDLTGAGIGIESGSNNTICANKIVEAGGIRVLIGNGNIFFANYLANNYEGATIGGKNTLYHNDFVNNAVQIGVEWGHDTNMWDNGKEGNYWSDYVGVDTNGDGVGDSPYVVSGNVYDRYPLMAPFNIDNVTVPLPTWAKTDPSLTQPPTPSPTPTTTSLKTPTATTSPTSATSTPTTTSTILSPTLQSPTSTTTTSNNPVIPMDMYWITAAAATITAVMVLAVVLKKKKTTQQ